MRRLGGLAWTVVLAVGLAGCGAGRVTCREVLNPSPEQAVEVAKRINAVLTQHGVDPQDPADPQAAELIERLTAFCADEDNLARDIDEAFP